MVINLEEDIKSMQQAIKDRFNELKNLWKENQCCKEFIRDRRLIDEYDKFRIDFYRNREWKKEK